jgi:hypothetical protein
MRGRRLLTLFSASFSIVISLFISSGIAHATTIVSVIGKSGIVILADSKTSVPKGAIAGETMCRGVNIEKIAVVQGRWAVAASDSACFDEYVRFVNGKEMEVAFDFIPWIHELEGSLPKDISFDQFTHTIREKFSDLMPKVTSLCSKRCVGGTGKPR